MLLQEMTEDNNLIIELSMNGQKYEFPSKVIRKVNQGVLVEPIRINGKILSFNSSGGGITVSIYMIRVNDIISFLNSFFNQFRLPFPEMNNCARSQLLL